MILMKKFSEKGFSMVEMAIVITIIGLLMTGIIMGREMIGAANINKVISDLRSYQVAYDQFSEKYEGIAGDLSDATTYWPTTNNGTGNSIINEQGVTVDFDESYLAWQHLALAGFIKGVYTGTNNGPDFDPIVPGGNLPASSYPGSAYDMVSLIDIDTGADTNINFILVGRADVGGGSLTLNVVPESDASDIERKLDSGTEAEGVVTYTCDAAEPGNRFCMLRYFLNLRPNL